MWLCLNIDTETCTETTQDREPMDRTVSLRKQERVASQMRQVLVSQMDPW